MTDQDTAAGKLPEGIEVRLRQAGRRERRWQKLKVSHCSACGATDISILQSIVVCAGCRSAIQGNSSIENHHLLGREYSSFSIPIPANLHAILSDKALDHPRNIIIELKVLYAFKDVLEVLYELALGDIERLKSKDND